MSAIQSESETQQPCWRLKTSSSTVDDLSELTRFTPALLSPRFRLSVGTLVLRGKGGILSLLEDRESCIEANKTVGAKQMAKNSNCSSFGACVSNVFVRKRCQAERIVMLVIRENVIDFQFLHVCSDDEIGK